MVDLGLVYVSEVTNQFGRLGGLLTSNLAEHYEVGQGVATQSIGSVQAGCHFSGGIQAGHRGLLGVGVDLDATHHVMGCWPDLHWLLGDVHCSEFLELVMHPRELLHDLLWIAPGDVEVDAAVLGRPPRITLAVDRLGNHVAGQQLGRPAMRSELTGDDLVDPSERLLLGVGEQINELLEKIGKQSEFVQGMRITDSETMEVVEMVLGGQINKSIVNLINANGGRAVGLTGEDGSLIIAEKLYMFRNEYNSTACTAERIDLGHVGKVKSIDTSVIDMLTQNNFIPVIAPIGVGEDRQLYNINADLVASRLSEILQAEKLILLTNTPGLLNGKGQLLPEINVKQVDSLIDSGIIYGGMLPKIKSALEAVQVGVTTAHIIDGRVQHAVLLEIFTNEGIGTLICKNKL